MQGPITAPIVRPTWSAEDQRTSAGGKTPAEAARSFAPVLRAVAERSSMGQDRLGYEIQRGDTLSGIAQRALREMGLPSNPADVATAVGRLASSNGITDPNRIYAGDRLDLKAIQPDVSASWRRGPPDFGSDRWRAGGLSAHRLAVSPGPERHASPVVPAHVRLSGQTTVASNAKGTVERPIAASVSASASSGARSANFPQLDRTLDRAVDRGYIEPAERRAVHDRIVELGRKFNFSPDDFATVALMESDGLNPRATNGRCHGILQFCEGPASGAASVGMRGRATEIRNQTVLSQLDLAERYFEDNRLGEKGPVSLVDLYLTVLTPAARSEQRPYAALDIAGLQAKALHTGGDRSQPITRNSILNGLLGHARQSLEALMPLRRDAELQARGSVQVGSTPVAAPTQSDGSRERQRAGVDDATMRSAQGRQG